MPREIDDEGAADAGRDPSVREELLEAPVGSYHEALSNVYFHCFRLLGDAFELRRS